MLYWLMFLFALICVCLVAMWLDHKIARRLQTSASSVESSTPKPPANEGIDDGEGDEG